LTSEGIVGDVDEEERRLHKRINKNGELRGKRVVVEQELRKRREVSKLQRYVASKRVVIER